MALVVEGKLALVVEEKALMEEKVLVLASGRQVGRGKKRQSVVDDSDGSEIGLKGGRDDCSSG
eukprot:5530538-Ditylum_brightwellii.AAC.1